MVDDFINNYVNFDWILNNTMSLLCKQLKLYAFLPFKIQFQIFWNESNIEFKGTI